MSVVDCCGFCLSLLGCSCCSCCCCVGAVVFDNDKCVVINSNQVDALNSNFVDAVFVAVAGPILRN